MVAHRAYYEKYKDPIPEGMTLDHLCRNRGCVNPDHMDAVTLAENCRRGTGTKLTAADVSEIIAAVKGGERVTRIARAKGISHSMASMIVSGKRWVAA